MCVCVRACACVKRAEGTGQDRDRESVDRTTERERTERKERRKGNGTCMVQRSGRTRTSARLSHLVEDSKCLGPCFVVNIGVSFRSLRRGIWWRRLYRDRTKDRTKDMTRLLHSTALRSCPYMQAAGRTDQRQTHTIQTIQADKDRHY